VTAEQIAHRLQARPSRRGWTASCPGPNHAHGDRSRGLSIGEGREGRVILKCFAGCSIEAICDALGIKVSDLFQTGGTVTPRPRIAREAEWRIRDLRIRLYTPRDRLLAVTVVTCDRENVDAGIARALALAVEGEMVQVTLVDRL